MRKRLTRCAVAAGLILIVLLVVVSRSHPPGIWIVKPLPPGKVKPQLANARSAGVLLAPDGSLWAWGWYAFRNTTVFPQPDSSQVPQRVGSDADWIQVTAGEVYTLALKNDGSLWGWHARDFWTE
jgi:alpha-tubulin suppressor-like RCC1 family protein